MKRLIGALGLRYRPSAQADLEEHAASLALLASDLADIPPSYLDRAIRKWVLQSHFMPKASDLAELAKGFASQPTDGIPVDMAARRNAKNLSEGRTNLHWYYDPQGQIRLESAAEQYERERRA